LHRLGDAPNTKTPADDGVLGFVLIREALEIIFEQTLEHVDSLIPRGWYTLVVTEGSWKDS
jgi:hypothetical protein